MMSEKVILISIDGMRPDGFFYGSSFEPGKKLETASLLDLAPTIAKLTGVSPAREWEGRVIGGV